MKIFQPFSRINNSTNSIILFSWLVLLLTVWLILSVTGETHLFPTINQVSNGLRKLWNDGLIIHVFSSLKLCLIAVFVSTFISLVISYLSPVSALKPLSLIISKLRYLPLTGISFYIAILITDARMIQVWVLVVFMSTYLITTLLGMISDIPQEEFDHARTLGCSKWETLLEVIIKGRMDYVIEAIRQNIAIVWVFVVTVESILASAGGLGFLIKNNDRLGDAGKVIGLQIIIVLIGIFLDYSLTKIRQVSFRFSWK